LQICRGVQDVAPIGGIVGVAMGGMDGVGIGGIAGGRGGTMSSVESHSGTWRHVPLVQSKVQVQAACAGTAMARRTATRIRRCIVYRSSFVVVS
jgi:hypothetical protein